MNAAVNDLTNVQVSNPSRSEEDGLWRFFTNRLILTSLARPSHPLCFSLRAVEGKRSTAGKQHPSLWNIWIVLKGQALWH